MMGHARITLADQNYHKTVAKAAFDKEDGGETIGAAMRTGFNEVRRGWRGR
jgi:hypothetical protein